MSALPLYDLEPDWDDTPQPYDTGRLDDALGDNFRALPLPDGSIEVDCSGCHRYVVDDIEQALALIDHHRQLHDAENQAGA